MTTASAPAAAPSVACASALRRRLARHAAALVAGSVAGGLALQWLHVSAALLFGPLAAALVLAARASPLRVPPRALVLAQAIVGCMIARSLPIALLGEIGRGWPLFLASVASVIALAAALGWAMAR